MNLALAKEVYGTPWMVDHLSFMQMSAILLNSQKGITLELPETKYNTPFVISTSNETRLVQYGWQMDDVTFAQGIGVINLDGVITLSGGASSEGMEQLSARMLTMAADERIIGFIILANSGGGASSAVEVMVDTINTVKGYGTPVYGVIKKGGMAASACFGILSACNSIYSESEMNIVGSAGTMIQFEGREANTEDPDGVKHIRVYATKSTQKNKAFEDAVNKNQYELLVNDLLDPINERFLSMIEKNRPQLKGTDFDNGNTKFSKDAIGTFIDGIASFDEVVSMIVAESVENPVEILNSNNQNSLTMNKAEIKNAHPTVYNEIVSEGVTAERERVASWMVYAKADPEAVTAGVEGGESISPSQREKLMVKMNSVNMLDALKNDSNKDVNTPESKTDITPVENAASAEAKEAFNFEINKN